MISTKAKLQRLVFVGFLLLSCSLAIVYFYARDQFRDAIQASGEAGNAALTRVFVNESWAEISRLLPPPGADAEAAQKNPNIRQIDEKIRRFAMYTDVVKVKLYNMKGLTVYSSEAKQIGEDKSSNAGFQVAARGALASELTTRGKFSAFDAEIYNRDLVSTYAPIREGYQIVAVAEIYSDRTASLKVTETLLNKFLLLMIGVFSVLFVAVVAVLVKVSSLLRDRQPNLPVVPSSIGRDVQDGPAIGSASPACPAGLRFYTAGFGSLIHNLNLAEVLGGQKPSRLSPQFAIGLLTQLSVVMRDRAMRCRHLMQIQAGQYQAQLAPISIAEVEQSVNRYADCFKKTRRPEINFFVASTTNPSFVQDQQLLLHYLKTLIDLAASHYPGSKLQIKCFWGDASLRIESILSGARVATDGDQPVPASVFQLQIETLANQIGESSKAVFSATGGVVSLEMAGNAGPIRSGNLPAGSVLILGGSEAQIGLLGIGLQGLGVEYSHLTELAEIEKFTPADSVSAVFVWPDLLDVAQMESLLRLFRDKGWASPERTFVVRDIFDPESLPDGGYQVLDQPFDLALLRVALSTPN